MSTVLFSRKNLTGKLLMVVLLFMLAVFPRPVMANISNEKVLAITPVTDGLVLEKRAGTINGGQVLIYILRADLSNQYLKVDTLLGAGDSLEKNTSVTNMALKSGAVAAVNADFFQMSESGRPIGMTYKDGQMITSAPIRDDMPGWAITKSGIPIIQVFNFQGTVKASNGMQFTLSGVNKPSYFQSGGQTCHENTILMYNRYWGSISRGKVNSEDNVMEVFVSNGMVIDISENSPGKAIPSDGYVLAGRGSGADYIKTNVKIGDKLSLDYSLFPEGDNIAAGTGGWSILVDQGQVMRDFPSSINGANARTAVGYSGNKKNFYVVVVEKSSASRGMTLNELADYMDGLGIERALNLDGGGSTTIAARPLGETQAVLVNRPSGTTQRSVPTGLGFFSTAPLGTLSGLVISCPEQVFPGDSVKVKVKGYDSHYNPYPVVTENAVVTVESGPGVITDGFFSSSGTGLATIAVNLQGVRAVKSVKVLGAGDLKKITVSPSTILLEPGQSVALQVKAIGYDNMEYLLNPANYTATVSAGAGSVEKEVFIASDTPAQGEIRIVMGDYSVSVPVKVQVKGESSIEFSPGKSVTLTLEEMNLKFPANAFAGSVGISAEAGGEFSAVPQRYQVISTVTLQTTDKSLRLKAPADLNWKLQSGINGKKMVVLQLLNGKWQQVSSRTDEQNKMVIANVWEIAPIALAEDTGSQVSFKDMAGHWSAGAVSRLATAGIVSGYPDSRFEPARQINRSEFVVLLGKALGWEPAQGKGKFKDSGDIPSWSLGYVLTAYERGVISGYEDNTFRPEKRVTRAEMAVMITKALSLPASDQIKAVQVFTDGKTIPYWADGSVSAALAAGIMKGDSNKRFRPVDVATRAESAAMLDSVIAYVLKR